MTESELQNNALQGSSTFFGDKGSLRRKAIFLFVLLISLALVFGAILIHQVDTLMPSGGAFDAKMQGETIEKFQADMKMSLIVMTALLVGSLLVSMLYFLLRVIMPLEDLKRSTLQLADGKLDALEHLVANTTGPIKAIMENIHDLAINLQEVLLLVWNLSASDLEVMKMTITKLKDEDHDDHLDKVLENLGTLNQHLIDKQELVEQFELFNVTIQEKKVFAGDDPADFKNCEESCHG